MPARCRAHTEQNRRHRLAWAVGAVCDGRRRQSSTDSGCVYTGPQRHQPANSSSSSLRGARRARSRFSFHSFPNPPPHLVCHHSPFCVFPAPRYRPTRSTFFCVQPHRSGCLALSACVCVCVNSPCIRFFFTYYFQFGGTHTHTHRSFGLVMFIFCPGFCLGFVRAYACDAV